MQDTFDEIASSILLSDAELALTFIHIASCRNEDERRRSAFSKAAHAYESICRSIPCIRMTNTDLEKLGALLQEIRTQLGEAGPVVVTNG